MNTGEPVLHGMGWYLLCFVLLHMDKGGGNAIGRLLLTIIDLATKTNSSASSSFIVPCLTKEGDHG